MRKLNLDIDIDVNDIAEPGNESHDKLVNGEIEIREA